MWITILTNIKFMLDNAAASRECNARIREALNNYSSDEI